MKKIHGLQKETLRNFEIINPPKKSKYFSSSFIEENTMVNFRSKSTSLIKKYVFSDICNNKKLYLTG